MTQMDPALTGEAAEDGRPIQIGGRLRPSVDEDALRQRAARGTWSRAWGKLRKDRLSMMAATGLIIVVLVTLFGPIVSDLVLHTSPETIQRMPDGRVAVLQ